MSLTETLNKWDNYLSMRFNEFKRDLVRERHPSSEGLFLSGITDFYNTYCITGEQSAIQIYRKYLSNFMGVRFGRGR